MGENIVQIIITDAVVQIFPGKIASIFLQNKMESNQQRKIFIINNKINNLSVIINKDVIQVDIVKIMNIQNSTRSKRTKITVERQIRITLY